jgi:hypothetical protein
MKFKDETFPGVTFKAFCEANNLEVVVRELLVRRHAGRDAELSYGRVAGVES